jgi:hypothetical protein
MASSVVTVAVAATSSSADRKPVSDQQSQVSGESTNDPPKSQPSETESQQTTKEAEKAFLEMFRNLGSSYYSGSSSTLPGINQWILKEEHRKPLDWRKKRAQDYSFVLQAYLRLLEDR